MHPRPLSLLAPVALLCSATLARAEIDYNVAVKPTDKQIAVEITVPAQAGPVSVQIPNWMPGAYAYGNFYENIHDVTAADAKGAALAVTHPDNNTWTVQAPGNRPVKFSYWVPAGGQRRFMPGGDASVLQISGPATYMYVVGRKTENCKVSFQMPPNWPILVGLDEDKGSANTYVAPSYDVLADNPVSTGDVIVDKYTLRGRDHFVVLEGAAKSQVNRQKLLTDCRFVSAAETDFFGGAPYHKYIWHFTVFEAPDGAGGLEHLSSTQISLSSGEGPRAQSVLAHEFFHLWNVKRTRAKVLGPFDYLTLPKTGSLWWLEGVTDYYASLLPYRYGEWKQQQFLDSAVRNLNAIKDNPARLEVSPYQASYRVGDAAGGRGNSNGFNISYYNLGWLCGLCLDIEIRNQTNNRHSLDDVTRGLYQLCKDNKPGFEEGEIRNQCVRFGGPALGPFFDRVVMSPGELPIQEQLAKAGLVLKENEEPFVDVGFTAQPIRGGHGARIGAVRGPGVGKVQSGDVITAVNGHSLDIDSFNQITTLLHDNVDGAQVGATLELTTKRGDQTMNVEIAPVQSSRKVRTIEPDPNASPAAKALGEKWLKTKTPAVP